MKIRHTLAGVATGTLLVVGLGAGEASAQTVRPDTGAATCTDTNLHQYTKYHGLICYSNTGRDDLRSSGFWTSAVYNPCYEGTIVYTEESGYLTYTKPLSPSSSLITFWSESPRTGLVSVIELDITKIDC